MTLAIPGVAYLDPAPGARALLVIDVAQRGYADVPPFLNHANVVVPCSSRADHGHLNLIMLPSDMMVTTPLPVTTRNSAMMAISINSDYNSG